MNRFSNRRVRYKVMDTVKAKQLKAKDLTNKNGFGDQPIHLNDHLAPEMKKVLGAVKACKAELGVKFIWTHKGNIFACKTEGSPVIKINTVEDIEKF